MQKKELIHLHTKTTAEEHGVEGRGEAVKTVQQIIDDFNADLRDLYEDIKAKPKTVTLQINQITHEIWKTEPSLAPYIQDRLRDYKVLDEKGTDYIRGQHNKYVPMHMLSLIGNEVYLDDKQLTGIMEMKINSSGDDLWYGIAELSIKMLVDLDPKKLFHGCNHLIQQSNNRRNISTIFKHFFKNIFLTQ